MNTDQRLNGQIRIGTLIGGADAATVIPAIAPYGFESYGITFWQTLGGAQLEEMAKTLVPLVQAGGAIISHLSIFGNPLAEDEAGTECVEGFRQLIDHASLFGCHLVTGFAGRVVDRPLPESIPRFKTVFGELARRAADQGVKLAFENCDMGGTWTAGDWNCAQFPVMWEAMFDAVPGESLGLQWEPCHQLVKLIDPIPQLRKWAPRVLNVHGKDATVAWDVVREYGITGARPFAWHRTPGFGDTNWADVITILMQNGYQGTIDIEGYHDPVHRGPLELSGQVAGLEYLKRSRGGLYHQNPPAWK